MSVLPLDLTLPFKPSSNYEKSFSKESGDNGKSTRDTYLIGLYLGYYLRRTVHDKRLIKALRSGNPVYFLARDMTPVWEYFASMYPNAKIVYNVNRSSMGSLSEKSMSEIIASQVDLTHKGLVVDSGFLGSVVKPIVERSKQVKDARAFTNADFQDSKRVLKGLLLSGARGSYFPYILDNTDTYGVDRRKHRGARNGRTIIYELEYSPKNEQYDVYQNDAKTYCSIDKNQQLKVKAFTLGFHAGLQGLNKKLISGNFRKAMAKEIRQRRITKQREIARQKLLTRINTAREINKSIKQGLKSMEIEAEHALHPETAYWKIQGTEIQRIKLLPNTPLGSHLGYSIWKTKKHALKALELHNRIRELSFNNNPYDRVDEQAKSIIVKLERIEYYEKVIQELKQQMKSDPTEAYVPTGIYANN